MRLLNSLLTLIVAAIMFSCSGGPQLMPNVSGKAGEVVVVINKGQWESEPGIALRSILAQDHPYLPQKEPLFDLINIPENAFSSIFQSHRNIIIVKTSSESKEPKIVYQENAWAAPQVVISITAATPKEISDIITKEKDKLTNTLLQAERNRNIQNAKKYEEKSLRAIVTEQFKGSPFFPKGYSLRKHTSNFIWISYETTSTNQGIFIYSYPYKDTSDLHLANIIAKRNEFLKENVPGPLENTYMTTNMMLEPGMRWVKYNKRNFIEIRSLWEVQNDFMGGPFVDHVFLDKENKNIIVLEAFVYAPRFNKRNYLRQVESIVFSFEFF